MRNKNRLHHKIQHQNKVLRNLATSLILYEKIKTTEKKAKKVKNLVEKMLNLGKRKDNASIRKLSQFFLDKNAVKKILEDLSFQFKDKKSGFIRIIRLGYRVGDGAPLSQVELILPIKAKKEAQAPQVKGKESKEKTASKVITRVKTKEKLPSTSSEIKKGKKVKKEVIKKEISKKEKITKKETFKPEQRKTKKGWLERVSTTPIGKGISSVTKKIWTKRTTSK